MITFILTKITKFFFIGCHDNIPWKYLYKRNLVDIQFLPTRSPINNIIEKGEKVTRIGAVIEQTFIFLFSLHTDFRGD